MNCRQAQNLFGAYWDDELTQAEREWLEAHFAACAACRTAYEDLGRTLELVGGFPRADVAPDFAERALARARRAAAEPDRVPAVTPRWIPITATAALLAVLGTMVYQWIGFPQGPARRDAPIALDERIEQPVRISAGQVPPAAAVGSREGGSSGGAASGALVAAAGEIPDSLFDHAEDVEFILDAVTLRKGRAHTVVRAPQDQPRAQQAVITF